MSREAISVGFPGPNYVVETDNRSAILPGAYLAETALPPIDGTLDAAESGSDTAAFSGTVLVAGDLAATESGSDTAEIAGEVVVSGSLAAIEAGADTADIAGIVGAAVGDLAATESGADITGIAGTVAVSGGLAAEESDGDTAGLGGAADLGPPGRAAINVGFPDPNYVVETGNRSAILPGLYLTDSAPLTSFLAAVESGSDVAAIVGTVGSADTFPRSLLLAATRRGSPGPVRRATPEQVRRTGDSDAGRLRTGSSYKRLLGRSVRH